MPPATSKLPPLSVMPLVVPSVRSAVERSVEPLARTSRPAVTLKGIVPRLASLLIDSVPPLMVVMPVYVLIPLSATVPVPVSLVNAKAPPIAPDKLSSAPAPASTLLAAVIVRAPL